jgi:hypothetical protein
MRISRIGFVCIISYPEKNDAWREIKVFHYKSGLEPLLLLLT